MPGAPRRIAMVVIGTDGFVDYVQVPDGQKFMLGPVSVLKLITGLAPIRTARKALREFVETKQVMLSVDLDKMWALLPFRRSRYSSSAASRVQTHPPLKSTREKDMSSHVEVVTSHIARIEEQLAVFDKHAKTATEPVSATMAAGRVTSLKNLIGDLREAAGSPYGDQSKNKDFYVGPKEHPDTAPDAKTAGMPPEFLEQQKKMKEKSEDKSDDKKDDDKSEKKKASYDTFMAHTGMAEEIVSKVSAADAAIDRLVSAGKKFNSVRAKADLHKIASRVTEIAQNVDMAQPWVGGDLGALAKQANEIHDLFVKE